MRGGSKNPTVPRLFIPMMTSRRSTTMRKRIFASNLKFIICSDCIAEGGSWRNQLLSRFERGQLAQLHDLFATFIKVGWSQPSLECLLEAGPFSIDDGIPRRIAVSLLV